MEASALQVYVQLTDAAANGTSLPPLIRAIHDLCAQYSVPSLFLLIGYVLILRAGLRGLARISLGLT